MLFVCRIVVILVPGERVRFERPGLADEAEVPPFVAGTPE